MAAETVDQASVVLVVPSCAAFEIQPEGKTQLASGKLEVLAVANAASPGKEFILLRIGSFSYPLSLGTHVPTLRIGARHYVVPLPDDKYCGLVFADDTAAETCVEFEKLLAEMTDYRSEELVDEAAPEAADDADTAAAFAAASAAQPAQPAPAAQPAPTPTRPVVATTAAASTAAAAAGPTNAVAPRKSPLSTVSTGIDTGARYVGVALIASATLMGKGIASGGGFLKRRIAPKAKPVQVSDGMRDAVGKVHTATTSIVGVSHSVVAVAQDMAAAIAETAATAIRSTAVGKKLANSTPSPTVVAAKDVVVSSILAVNTLHTSLSRAGQILLKSVATTTTDVVGHRYGDQVAEVTATSFSSASNLLEASSNINSLGVKPIARTVARQTARDVMQPAIAGGSAVTVTELPDDDPPADEAAAADAAAAAGTPSTAPADSTAAAAAAATEGTAEAPASAVAAPPAGASEAEPPAAPIAAAAPNTAADEEFIAQPNVAIE